MSGPSERLWLESGFPIIEVAGLDRRRLLVTVGCPPCALLPAGSVGQARDDQFAALLIQLQVRREGWLPCLRRLVRYVEAASAVLVAVLLSEVGTSVLTLVG